MKIEVTRLCQKFCNICLCASFWNKVLELMGVELMPHPAACSLGPALLDYYPFLHLRCFNNQEEVWATKKGQELVSAWGQRIGWKMASDGAAWWPLLRMLGYFWCNLNNKTNKLLKYCKTFNSSLLLHVTFQTYWSTLVHAIQDEKY